MVFFLFFKVIKNENHHEMTLGWLEIESVSDMQMLDTLGSFLICWSLQYLKGP